MLPDHQMALFLTDWAFYVAIIVSFSSFQPSGDEKHHWLLFKSLRPSSSHRLSLHPSIPSADSNESPRRTRETSGQEAG